MDRAAPVSPTGMSGLLFGHKPEKKPQLLKKSLAEYYFDKLDAHVQPLQSQFDSIYYAPASEFGILRHKVACLDNQLVQARLQQKEDNKKLATRWAAAVANHNEVQATIPKFNGYYKDSFAKRERALDQHERELFKLTENEKELHRLQKERETLFKIKQDQELRLENFSVFKIYLDKVKMASQGEYSDVRELMDRYTVLAEARGTLHEKAEASRERVERKNKALERDVLNKSSEIIAYRNYLSELLDYQQSLHDQVVRLEDNLLRIKTTAASRTMMIGQTKMAIRNLYLQVCKHMHRNAKIVVEDTLGQLMDIRLSVRELSKLAKDIKNMLRSAYVEAEEEAKAREKQKRKTEERQKKIDKLRNAAVTDPRELFELPRLEKKKGDKGEDKGYVAFDERKSSVGTGNFGVVGMSFSRRY